MFLLFVLSSIPPEKHCNALKRLRRILKRGGKLLFRDYANGDLAQERFSSNSKVAENLFVRQDGTLSFFFTEERLQSIALDAGFQVVATKLIKRTIRNSKLKQAMHREWLQAELLAI